MAGRRFGKAQTIVRLNPSAPDFNAGLTERFRWQSSKLQSRVGLPDSAPVYAGEVAARSTSAAMIQTGSNFGPVIANGKQPVLHAGNGSSILPRSTKFMGLVDKRLSRLSVEQSIVSSNLT